jgi:carboxypeptidase family protein/TonB-dependent receptor-like protein
MKHNAPFGFHMLAVAAAIAMLVLAPAAARAQSQAIDGTIEGIVTDSTGAVLPGVTVTVRNLDTGAERAVVTNERGLYRAPLLPLGPYRVSAELPGFKKYEQSGIRLVAGSTAVVNVKLDVGDIAEVVSVMASAALVDTARIDMGRNLTEREIKNLPLVARNPYNFALIQPGVSGFENPEFGVPRFSANGSLLRINYQIDGNTNTQKDRAGLRLLPMSEVMISEVKVVTSGYAPEFGQTMGLVYNAVTPSGTNRVKGDFSYRFRRRSFSAYPFFFTGARVPENKPEGKINSWTANIGGPIVKDRLHYYLGFERTYRGLERVITLDPALVAQIGQPAQPSVVPQYQNVDFYLGKADYTVTGNHRLSARAIVFQNDNPYNGGAGGQTVMERSFDFRDRMYSASSQLVSSWGASRLNELRVQYSQRHQARFRHEGTPTGLSINISNTISFGAPTSDGEDFVQGITQVLDNFTLLRGSHSFKVGFDFQNVRDTRAVSLTQTYTFPTLAAYLAAKNGTNPLGYTTFAQVVGDPNFAMNSRLLSAFWQDDWRLTGDFKLLYGVRYDGYDYPAANASAPFSFSQKYADDWNNVAPRLGAVWTFGAAKETVLRASTGVMYDQPLLAVYENAIQQNGLPARTTFSLNATSACAPAFPNTLTNTSCTPAQSIFAPSPDYHVAHTIQNNVQVERALGKRYSASAGFVYVRGYSLPVINNYNLINPIGTLADGRGIYSTAVNANTRRDPRFNAINVVESVGNSTYKALVLTFGRRYAGGVQYDLNYTLGKGIDNAPLTGTLAVQGDDGRSDPVDLERDRGPNALDTRHTFNGSIVATSSFRRGSRAVQALLSDNQVGLVVQFNSGIPLNVRSNRDLNGDGTGNDRPLFVGRNSVYLPARWNVDARLSRFIPINGSRRVEVLAEFKNIFNTVQVSGVNRGITVDTAGNPLIPIQFGSTRSDFTSVPTDGNDYPATGGYEQRKFQLGFKFYF